MTYFGNLSCVNAQRRRKTLPGEFNILFLLAGMLTCRLCEYLNALSDKNKTEILKEQNVLVRKEMGPFKSVHRKLTDRVSELYSDYIT